MDFPRGRRRAGAAAWRGTRAERTAAGAPGGCAPAQGAPGSHDYSGTMGHSTNGHFRNRSIGGTYHI